MKSLVSVPLLAILLSGCGMFRADSQSETQTVTHITGAIDGKMIDVQMDAHAQSRGSTDISLNTDTIMGWTTLILNGLGGGTGIMAMILAWREKSRADEHKADATDGWNQAMRRNDA